MTLSLTQEKHVNRGDREDQVATAANVHQLSNDALGLCPKQVIKRNQRDRPGQDCPEPGRSSRLALAEDCPNCQGGDNDPDAYDLAPALGHISIMP